jgi:hypothetical protein
LGQVKPPTQLLERGKKEAKRHPLTSQEFCDTLYLAIPEDTYDRFFTLQFIQDALRYNEVRYLVYDGQGEAIVQWQN